MQRLSLPKMVWHCFLPNMQDIKRNVAIGSHLGEHQTVRLIKEFMGSELHSTCRMHGKLADKAPISQDSFYGGIGLPNPNAEHVLVYLQNFSMNPVVCCKCVWPDLMKSSRL